MNKIIESFLNTHISEYGIAEMNKEDAFEHFINRLIINKYSVERFDPDDIMTGKGEIGLDGIGIIVNDILVTDDDSLEKALNKSTSLVVKFVFIQSKTSESFDGSEIGTFSYGVESFFETKENRPKTNEKIEKLIKLKDTIYANSIDFQETPSLEMYYVCCGKWNEGNNLEHRIKSEEKKFIETQNFGFVKLRPYDTENIITSYKELKKKISKKFTMERRFSFPKMKGIKQAYTGLIKCRDYIDILKDSEGNMLNNIFEDNVRDFQGYNPVNVEILNTISDSNEQESFAVLNNGITIIAKKIEPIGDQIEIFDYQIVNGCQTSNVLFTAQDKIGDNVYLLAKIIEVQQDEILNRIIYTTNRQTEVKSEAFASSKPFHKGLEDYFNAVEIDKRLYYERRSKQYELSDGIDKNRVVSLSSLTYAYIAVFLNEPHSTHRYYGELLQAYKNKIFIEGAYYDPYYISAYFSFTIGQLIKSGVLPSNKYSKFKFHIACIMKTIVVGSAIDAGDSRNIKNKSKKLLSYIESEDKIKDLIKTATGCLEEAISRSGDLPKQSLHRTKEFTQLVLDIANKFSLVKNSTDFLQKGNIVQCVVKSINASYANVEIKTQDERKLGSIHISQITDRFVSDFKKYFSVTDLIEAQIIGDEYDTKFGWQLSAKLNNWDR